MPVVPPHVVLLDSITQVDSGHAGRCVVTGSHGGVSAARYAADVRAQIYVFNDAGVGKDGAGIAALALLDAGGQAAATVAHTSARIGSAQDSWDSGIISHVNAAAAGFGLRPGMPLNEGLATLTGNR